MKRAVERNKKRQVKQLWCINRHDILIKAILEGTLEGKWVRGRQPYRWEENTKRWMNYSSLK